ncbi:MAG: hypothetical protein P4M09_04270 [Devosia sp.]|nr:hypothetical protein [Devosia sp.]
MALLAVFLLVYGAQSTLIGSLGSALPYSDQWNFEALGLYRPYLAGTLDWMQLAAPYNEHRMLFTRLLLLGLFELAGGWDPVLAMLVNSLLHALFAALFTAFVVKATPPPARLIVFGFALLCFVLPVGFENTLMGMNSHFYMFLLLSFGCLTLIAKSPAFSTGWIAGLVCGLLTGFTLASGALSVLAAAVVPALQLAAGVRARRWGEFAGVGLTAIAGIAMVASVAHDAASLALQAHNLMDFIPAALAVASLPLFSGVGLVFVHAPLFWLVGHTVLRKRPRDGREWGLVAVAAWIAAQILAIAYSRYEMALSSRYFDIIILLLPLDLVALTIWLARLPEEGRRSWLALYAGGWLFVVVLAIGAGAHFSSWRLAAQEKTELDASQSKVTAYLETHDLAQLQGVVGWLYPDLKQLGNILSDPEVRLFLPTDILPPGSDPTALRDKTVLKGRLADIADLLKLILGAGPVWLALGAAFAFLAGARQILRPPNRA